MITRKWWGAVLSAAMLSGLLAQTAGASGANGWQYENGFTDKATGQTYYNAWNRSGTQIAARVVYADQTGQWHALPQKYISLTPSMTLGWKGFFVGTPTALVYDPGSGSVTREPLYTSSPNGKWGYRQSTIYKLGPVNPNGRWTSKFTSYIIADYATGKVRYWMDTPLTSRVFWTSDNKLLLMRYSEKAKQNEIVLHDPATGVENRVLLASLIGYDSKTDKMLIEYNEPTRKNWLYDIKTSRKTALTGEQTDQFLQQIRSADAASVPLKPVTAPPSGLQPEQMPITPVKETLRPAATATINGHVVELPFCYLLGGRARIPVEPLVAAFGVQVERQADRSGSSHTFTLTHDGYSLTVNDDAVYGARLFLTKDQLEKLGLRLDALHWQPRG